MPYGAVAASKAGFRQALDKYKRRRPGRRKPDERLVPRRPPGKDEKVNKRRPRKDRRQDPIKGKRIGPPPGKKRGSTVRPLPAPGLPAPGGNRMDPRRKDALNRLLTIAAAQASARRGRR